MVDFDHKFVISQTASELKNLIQAGRIPNALVFVGNPGLGKKQAAFEVAKACNCRGAVPKPCNLCLPCKKIDARMHPDMILVSLAEKKKIISISQIREMRLKISAKPNEAAMRMVLILDAEFMNVQAQNALLKVLEEPPENTFFILSATRISPLLPTILSRCRQIRFKPLSGEILEKHLTEQFGLDSQSAHIAAHTAGADLKKALMFLNLGDDIKTDWIKRRTWVVKEFLDLVSQPNQVWKGLGLSRTLSLDPDLVLDTVTIIRTLLRDFCIFQFSPEKIVNLDFLKIIKDIDLRFDDMTLLGWTKELDETDKRLRSNSSIRLTLDQFFVKLTLTLK